MSPAGILVREVERVGEEFEREVVRGRSVTDLEEGSVSPTVTGLWLEK